MLNIWLIIIWLVVLTILKNVKVNGKDYPIYYGKSQMIETTNQIYIYIYIILSVYIRTIIYIYILHYMYYRLNDLIYTYINILFFIYWENEFRIKPIYIIYQKLDSFFAPTQKQVRAAPPLGRSSN